MAIDFPASPTNGQTFIVGGVTYTFDNTKWTAVAVAGAIDAITEGNSSAEVIDTGSDGRFVVTTEGTERARVDSSGRLLVGTSSANANGGILQLTSGITFPATAVAATDVNTLDDYEEGTFTPTVSGSSTAGTATYSQNSGRYTKIGRLVQFEFYLVWSSGTGVGNLRIDGLPFTAGSSNTYPAGSIAYLNNLTLPDNHIAVAMVLSNSTTIWIRSTPVGGGAAGEVAYDSDASIIVSGTYSV
jgi:hypothetical protein